MNTICVLRDITVVRGEHYNFYVQEHCGEGNFTIYDNDDQIK